MEHSRLLFIEDDPAIAKAVSRGLSQEGYSVDHISHGNQALQYISDTQPDLVLLDIRLPGMDGFTICKSLREAGNPIPIIMVTARDEEIDKIIGLEIGADDYIVKPFSLRELQSRIKALLRRSYGSLHLNENPPNPGVITIASLEFHQKSQRLYKLIPDSTQEEIFLTPTETKLLLFFIENPDQVVSREQIIQAVWGQQIFLEAERTVDVHIRHLREKIEPDPSQPSIVQTVRGFGYRFRHDPH
jgi:DNA-binding response OmpR family regulator